MQQGNKGAKTNGNNVYMFNSAVLQEVSDTNKNYLYLGIRHKWLNVNIIFVFQIHFIC